MTLYAGLFYLLAAATLGATALALTRRVLMHAVVWMVTALFATALIFFLLGAPLLAAFEVIIYAGAIMVLFLFVIMLLRQEDQETGLAALLRMIRRFLLPALLAVAGMVGGVALIFFESWDKAPLPLARAEPGELGAWLYENAWPAVEAVSLLLLAALVGAYFLGRARPEPEEPEEGSPAASKGGRP